MASERLIEAKTRMDEIEDKRKQLVGNAATIIVRSLNGVTNVNTARDYVGQLLSPFSEEEQVEILTTALTAITVNDVTTPSGSRQHRSSSAMFGRSRS